MAVNFVENAAAPFETRPPGRVSGPAAMRGTVQWLISQFPDINYEIEAIVADGDLVVCSNAYVASAADERPLGQTVSWTIGVENVAVLSELDSSNSRRPEMGTFTSWCVSSPAINHPRRTPGGCSYTRPSGIDICRRRWVGRIPCHWGWSPGLRRCPHRAGTSDWSVRQV